ncbi:unnamed protein product [Calicophoron daubneyi]|uniref:K Homology domain-containing protein n=1 Tax=Calicophoron daubneyi TaxID=300641 RepID=A0AAV2T0V8_CALDB
MQEDEGHPEKEADITAPASHSARKRNDTIHMKILVPSGAVGAIIGKRGESIAQVQWETGARIKLSKPNDFYPGTVERVCLIQGTLEGVTKMHNYIMDRMLEKPECTGPSGMMMAGPGPPPPPSSAAAPTTSARLGGSAVSPGATTGTTTLPTESAATTSTGWNQSTAIQGSRLPWGRHQQVKILVPNCTAGLVIGKVGSYVKEIKDRTGAFIQISQKSKEINLLERCITIAGEPDQCRAAVDLVLAKIAEDPQSTSCPTISYSHVQGPVASAYPTGSPFAFATVPRFPVSGGPSHAHVLSNLGIGSSADATGTAGGYYPVSDPYSSVFHAALLQAAAAAAAAAGLNQRSYYTAPAGYMATSPPPPAPSAQQSMSLSTTNIPTMTSQPSLVYTSPDSSNPPSTAVPSELGLYAALPSSASTQLLAGTGLLPGPAAEGSWGSPEAQLSGLATTPTGYEQPYPGALNYAYYPSNQSMLASLASRHPSEAYPTSPDIYPTSPPYGTNIPIPYNSGASLRAAGPSAPQLTPMYPGLTSQMALAQPPLAQQIGPDSSAPGMAKMPMGQQPSSVPLNELFGSLRLSSSYPELATPDLNQAFSALQQRGYLNLPGLGGYPVLPSPLASTTASVFQPLTTSFTVPVAEPVTMIPGRPPAASSQFSFEPSAAAYPPGPPREGHISGGVGGVYGRGSVGGPGRGCAPSGGPDQSSPAGVYPDAPPMTVKRRGCPGESSDKGMRDFGPQCPTEELRSSVIGTRPKDSKPAFSTPRPSSCYESSSSVPSTTNLSSVDPAGDNSQTSDSRVEDADQAHLERAPSADAPDGNPADGTRCGQPGQSGFSSGSRFTGTSLFPRPPITTVSLGDGCGSKTIQPHSVKHIFNGQNNTSGKKATPNGIKK